jgi:hypothetical protein
MVGQSYIYHESQPDTTMVIELMPDLDFSPATNFSTSVSAAPRPVNVQTLRQQGVGFTTYTCPTGKYAEIVVMLTAKNTEGCIISIDGVAIFEVPDTFSLDVTACPSKFTILAEQTLDLQCYGISSVLGAVIMEYVA